MCRPDRAEVPAGMQLIRTVLCTALLAASASAETYQILLGKIGNHDLTGRFDAVRFESGGSFRILLVEDFALEAGAYTFTPVAPIEFDGLVPIGYGAPADLIAFYENSVVSTWLRTGGEPIEASPDAVTFRFLEFRSEAADRGHAVGLLGDGVLPRRLHLAGTLFVVEQTFDIRSTGCSILPSEPDAFARPDRRIGEVSTAAVGIIVVPITPIPLPCGLSPQFPPVERPAGRWQLVATAARPIEIDVRIPNDVLTPESNEQVWVAILGSDEIDVRDVDPGSLRLGTGDAAPSSRGAAQRDVDRDGDLDLVARFRARDTVGVYRNDPICLSALTYSGEALDGCDATPTRPPR